MVVLAIRALSFLGFILGPLVFENSQVRIGTASLRSSDCHGGWFQLAFAPLAAQPCVKPFSVSILALLAGKGQQLNAVRKMKNVAPVAKSMASRVNGAGRQDGRNDSWCKTVAGNLAGAAMLLYTHS